MAIQTKSIKISEKDITIIQFSALEALKLRAELVAIVKNKIGDLGSLSLNGELSLIAPLMSLIYELPTSLLLKLFANCSVMGLGGLSYEENFNSTFTDNLDGVTELALEVVKFNGFFTKNIFTKLQTLITEDMTK